jgi:peroxiredoxin
MAQENKQNLGLIFGIVGAVVLVVVLVIYSGKSNLNSGGADVAGHFHPSSVNSNSEKLNNLLGKTAPSFDLTDIEGNAYSLENLKGKKVVLFFNEGLMCYPACWNQIAALSQDERFNKDGDVVALSIVVDSKDDWQKAIDQMPELKGAKVLFDRGAAISKKFGVLNLSSSMHPGSLPGHTFVVLDKEGTVRWIFDDPNMGIRNDQLAAEIAKLNP